MKTIFDRMECEKAERSDKAAGEYGYWLFHTVTLRKTFPYFEDDQHFEVAKWLLNKDVVLFYSTYKDYIEGNESARATCFLDYLPDEFPESDSSQEPSCPPETTKHPLFTVFDDVLKQVTDGKGNERHGKTEDGRDLTFLDQPLMVITRYVGNGFPLGQAMKKLSEVPAILSQKGKDAAYQEILGAIAYAASAALYLQEKSIHD